VGSRMSLRGRTSPALQGAAENLVMVGIIGIEDRARGSEDQRMWIPARPFENMCAFEHIGTLVVC